MMKQSVRQPIHSKMMRCGENEEGELVSVVHRKTRVEEMDIKNYRENKHAIETMLMLDANVKAKKINQKQN